MNKYKVGQQVTVISASTGTNLNVNGWTGEIMEVQSDNFVGIRFVGYNNTIYPLLYCFTDDGIVLNLEVIATPKWLPIDPNNLSGENVLAGNISDLSKPLIGYLRRDSETYQMYLKVFGSDHRVTGLTHYIPLADLLNLPISE